MPRSAQVSPLNSARMEHRLTIIFSLLNYLLTVLEEVIAKSSKLVKIWLLTKINEDLQYIKPKDYKGISKAMLDKYHIRQ
jgi:hypothetical protein